MGMDLARLEDGRYN